VPTTTGLRRVGNLRRPGRTDVGYRNPVNPHRAGGGTREGLFFFFPFFFSSLYLMAEQARPPKCLLNQPRLHSRSGIGEPRTEGAGDAVARSVDEDVVSSALQRDVGPFNVLPRTKFEGRVLLFGTAD